MIGKLTGRVDYVAEDHALIEVGGVGYLVHCAAPTLAGLVPGRTAALYTELLVREDLMQLMGFATVAEREWYRLLTSVQGVGGRVALAILGTVGADGLARALAAGDALAVQAAPGVGPKLAARVVRELRGKAPDRLGAMRRSGRDAATPPAQPVAEGDAGAEVIERPAPAAPPAPAAAARAAARSARVNLGYDRTEAYEAILRAAPEGSAAPGPAGLIRSALRALDAERAR
ncbi:MAG: Holliday junction branch migration protein RuvA [Paracoccaceae bacterium]